MPAVPDRQRLIVAFDLPTARQALRLAMQLRGLIGYAKIGSILFTAEGPDIIKRIRALGFEVFLDLKFHDIPSTVEKSCRAAVRHRVSMLTVHASGTAPMLEAAAFGVRDEAARRRLRPPAVLGVTVLTSDGGERRQAITHRVTQLAKDAKRARLDGVVCSVWEAQAVRRVVGSQMRIVCPGIRLPDADASDQRRVATPYDAIAQGADHLVIGRPITGAANPRRAAFQMLEAMRMESTKGNRLAS